MLLSEKGSATFKVLVFLGLIVLFGLISLPSLVDTHKADKKEECLKNLHEIEGAIKALCAKTKQDFEGTLRDLKDKGYLKAILDCPESKEHGTGYGVARTMFLQKKNSATGEMENIIDPSTDEPMFKIDRYVFGKYNAADTTVSVSVMCPNEKDFPEHILK